VKVGLPVVDQAAGQVIVSTALAAFLRRCREPDDTGERHHVVALFDVALTLQAMGITEFLATGRAPGRVGNASPLSAPNETLRSSDGDVMVAAYLPEQWQRFCRVLECPELTTDPRFHSQEARMANRTALIEELERRTTRYRASELLELLDGAGLMAGVIRSYPSVVGCEQVLANDLLVEVRSSLGTPYQVVRSPLNPFEADAALTIPATGEHILEILGELGLSRDEIDTLVAAGTVTQP
jgi:crotonobetainyl-CoA:carnitine CoA-transferase CaiB-like acyl-CoA transferase